MRPLTPIMRAVLQAVSDAEATSRANAKAHGTRRHMWLGAQPAVIAQRVQQALHLEPTRNPSSYISRPLGALVDRGLLVRSYAYERASHAIVARYLLTAAGRRLTKDG